MTNSEARRARGLLVAAVTLLVTWAAAGVVNANQFLMGNVPSATGVVVSLMAVCIWPVVGWFAGSQSGTGFLRLATAFWATVVVGTPLVAWAFSSAPGLTVMQGGFVLPLLLFALAAPLYGLVALLPTWDPFAWETILWTVVIGVSVFGVTLSAYLVQRRRTRRRATGAGPG